jgi:hypothetical protein
VPGRPLHEGRARGPGRDVQHIGAIDGVKVLRKRAIKTGPRRCHDVEQERGLHLAGTGLCAPPSDRVKSIRLGISGLPHPSGQAGGKVRHMLARATGNLQCAAVWRQNLGQDLQNRFAIAFSRLTVIARVWAQKGVPGYLSLNNGGLDVLPPIFLKSMLYFTAIMQDGGSFHAAAF